MNENSSRKQRKTDRRVILVAAIALFILFNVAVTYIFGSLGWFIVTSEPPYYTLSGVTDTYFESVNPDGKRVELTLCMSEDDMEETSSP